MVHVKTLEKDYDASYKLDGAEHKIFDAVPKAICDLKQAFLDRVSAGEIDQLESDTQKDLERDELVVYENGQEVAVINNIDQIKQLEYLTGEQKDFILMHFQRFEASLSIYLRGDYDESKDFNFGKTLGRNSCYNSLAIERDDDGEVKNVVYNRKRVYGYGTDQQIMERLEKEENLDQVYMSVESNITSLKADKMTADTTLPKFKLTVSAIDHTGLNGAKLIFPEPNEGNGINKTEHQSLKSFLIDCFVSKIKNNIEDKKISDLFFETFSVLATDTKLINILKNESVKVEREILLQNGELKPIETIKHYLNKLMELIFGAEQFLSSEQHSKIHSFVNNISNKSTTSKVR
ncbi:hypothetical protein N3Z17_02705 [Candidatus Bandiella numerosa]|uniref:hypothetical protein n=1 Tax=Candidatus Bandiella numerosa TaxID=2570586 RepID=UPI00249DF468|nr:hypothetical protein [Candidatus Bandiella numerosa]WHA05436.1 hypothetical protein N3Z17_02705 [Candidatus Bandiella numerosa]